MAGGAEHDRVFVKDGFRSYRRTYRVREVGWGLATFAVLLAIVGWVAWRGAHPDPSLFDVSAALLENGDGASPAASRGPLPAELAPPGFRESKIDAYPADDLYVKINGRAGYFQSFGVKTLYGVTLEAPAAGSEVAASVDIELYDMGSNENALGAYMGERTPGIASVVRSGATHHLDRNAAFLVRGNYYARLIGSEESEALSAALAHLVAVLAERLPGAEEPWGVQLFTTGLEVSPSRVSYVKQNAFSFGFARDVYVAKLSPDESQDDMEAFVVARADAGGAQALAEEYARGFSSLGRSGGSTPDGVALALDEVLGSYAGARAVERWVVGVRGAPSKAEAHDVLTRLAAAIAGMPDDVRERAVPADGASAGGEDTGDDTDEALGDEDEY